jgi:cytochrome c oxidase assembly protein subunit 15
VSLVLLAAAIAALRGGENRAAAAASVVLLLLAVQLAIGISMVLGGFPLWLATAHNAGAALLLLAILALNRSLRPSSAPPAFTG